jgi:hypothetical protein
LVGTGGAAVADNPARRTNATTATVRQKPRLRLIQGGIVALALLSLAYEGKPCDEQKFCRQQCYSGNGQTTCIEDFK